VVPIRTRAPVETCSSVRAVKVASSPKMPLVVVRSSNAEPSLATLRLVVAVSPKQLKHAREDDCSITHGSEHTVRSQALQATSQQQDPAIELQQYQHPITVPVHIIDAVRVILLHMAHLEKLRAHFTYALRCTA
jgi:hypothetical protein